MTSSGDEVEAGMNDDGPLEEQVVFSLADAVDNASQGEGDSPSTAEELPDPDCDDCDCQDCD